MAEPAAAPAPTKVDPASAPAPSAPAPADPKAAAPAAGGNEPPPSILQDPNAPPPKAGEPAPAPVEPTWPDDWRAQMAQGNKDVEKLLKRYASPQSVADAFKNLRGRLDSGEFKKPLPDNPTEDEIAAFRKEHGIPDKPEGYEFADGLEVSEIDKPILDAFKEYAHGKNWTPDQVKDVTSWYFAAREHENEQMYENDQAYRQQAEDALRSELGNEFRPSINGLRNFMQQTFGPELTASIFSARLGDGTLAGNNPAFLKGFIHLMKEVNPAATVTLPDGNYGGKGVEERIAELEKQMQADINAWQSDKNAAAQKEYVELLAARDKMKARDAA